MPRRPRFAKFRRASEPAIRDLLVRQRIATLEKFLTLLRAQVGRAPSEPARQGLLKKAREVEEMLERARRARGPSP